ncbi:MAG: hypothetical protein H6735_27555 [Alphaproteobacteria bacterium]|nr:hypothetical protein [Alphaproteobacteria bacterium]
MTLPLALQAAAVYALALPLSRLGPARGRRAVLVGATALVAALPLLALAPGWTPEAPAATALIEPWMVFQEPSVGGVAQAPAAVASSWWPGLGTLWALGAGLSLLRLTADLWAAHRLRRSARDRSGDVAYTDVLDVPAVVGWWRPLVLLPTVARAWPEPRVSLALAHERAHVVGRDNLWLLVSRLVACAHWFDPLAWLTVGALRDACEHAADEIVLDGGADPVAYAEALVAVARERAPRAGFAMARTSGLQRRVRAVLAERPVGRRFGGALRVGLLTSLAVGTATASPARRPAPVTAGGALDATLEAEVARIEEAFHPEGIALVVLDARTGETLGTAGRGGLLDRPVAPGSVLKPFVVAAALEGGLAADHVFPEGDMASILECSSNDGAMRIATLAGRDAVGDVLQRVGLPAPEGTPVERLALGDGLLVSPLQVARAWTHLAGDGAIAEPVAAEVRRMLVGVVEGEHGTGRRAAVPGTKVAGKTGTARLVRADGTVDADHTLATFVGLIPAEHPEHVVLVSVGGAQGDEGWGGVVAAPSFARIAGSL